MKRVFFILLIHIIIFGGYSQPDTSKQYIGPFVQEMEKLITKLMKRYNVVGLSVALVDDNKIVWAKGFGYEDKAKFIPATKETVYRIGSISKLFTATAVMQLVEQSVINLDSAYKKYIPKFSIRTRFTEAPEITPRMLMIHHSGLPGDILKGLMSYDAEHYSTIIQHLNEEYTAYPPNYIFAYSNIGASLLGYLIEKISGKAFELYADSALFRPLEMTHSSFTSTPVINESFSKGYKNGKQYEDPDIREMPAGLMVSNVDDLSKFIMMVFADGVFNGKQIISPLTLQEMLTPQNQGIPLDKSFKIGLIWWLTEPELEYAGKFAGHGGDTDVFHASLATLTDYKLGAVVLTNTSSGAAIASVISNKMLELALKYKSGINKPEPQKISIIRHSGINFDSIAGLYVTSGGLLDIRAKNNKLVTKVNRFKVQIYPNEKGTFSPRIVLFKLLPVSFRNDEIDFINQNGNWALLLKTMPVGEKVKVRNVPEEWKKRTGKYILLNKGNDKEYFKDTKLIIENGFLKFKTQYFNQNYTAILQPLNDNEAIILGLGRGMHETIRVISTDKNKEILRYSGYELEKSK
ncbi:MAG: beta-lactamase family protein [Bacteroidia bacterium]|nr:beta-lactamase family protein [Bacteroidia bacterium]